MRGGMIARMGRNSLFGTVHHEMDRYKAFLCSMILAPMAAGTCFSLA
jgi:hypothetical protein